MEIRRITADEAAAAGELVVTAYRAVPREQVSDDYAAELRDVAARDQGAEVLVATDGAELLGTVTYVPDAASPYAELMTEGEAGIRMLAVASEARGRGVGAALTLACIERARTAGRRALLLHSTQWMTAAHRLYERLGFRRDPDRDWDPEPGVCLRAYRLELERRR